MIDENAEVLNKNSLRDPVWSERIAHESDGSVRSQIYAFCYSRSCLGVFCSCPLVMDSLSQIEKLNYAVVAWMEYLSL